MRQDPATLGLDLLGRQGEVVGGRGVVRHAVRQGRGEVEGQDVGPLTGEPHRVGAPLPACRAGEKATLPSSVHSRVDPFCRCPVWPASHCLALAWH